MTHRPSSIDPRQSPARVVFARPDAPTAMLMGGSWRSPLSRTQWQAVVIPTLAANAARGIFPQRLACGIAVPFVPAVPTRSGALDWLADWGRQNGYGRLEIVELWPPMTAADRAMLDDLKRAVWPTPPPTFAAPAGRPAANPLVRP